MSKILFLFVFISLPCFSQTETPKTDLFGVINQIATEFNEKYLSTLTPAELIERENTVTRVNGYVLGGEIFFKKKNLDMDKKLSRDYQASNMNEVGLLPFEVELGTEGTIISAAAVGGYNMLGNNKQTGINNISYMKVKYLDTLNLDVVNLKFFELEALPVNFLKEGNNERLGPVLELSLGANWLAFKESASNLTSTEEALKSYNDGFSLVSGMGFSYKKTSETKSLKGEIKYKLYNYTNGSNIHYFNHDSNYQHDVNLRLGFSKKLKNRKSLSFFLESNLFLSGDTNISDLVSPQSVNLANQRGGVRFGF